VYLRHGRFFCCFVTFVVNLIVIESLTCVLFFNQIGQGTYSNVYKAKDTLTGKIVALKKVRFDNLEPESVKFMAREILILRRLDHPNVVKLEGLVTSRMSCSLYLVFQYMEHDLAGLSTSPAIKFTVSQVSKLLPFVIATRFMIQKRICLDLEFL
jgi:serine/threonine protein kinase